MMMMVTILETRTLGWVFLDAGCVPLGKWGVVADPGQLPASFLFRGKKPWKNWPDWDLLEAGAGLALPQTESCFFSHKTYLPQKLSPSASNKLLLKVKTELLVNISCTFCLVLVNTKQEHVHSKE